MNACISMSAMLLAEPEAWSPMILFVAEAPSAAAAESLAARAEAMAATGGTQAAGAAGQVLLMIASGISVTSDERLESPGALQALRDDLLREAAVSG